MTNLRVYSDQIGLSKKDLFELENCDLKIKLIEDFLFTDINHFKRCNINISNLTKAREKFFNLYTKRLEKITYKNLTTYLPIRNERLNKFLDGGLPANRVTELKGDRLSGKTLFCLNIVLDLIKSDKKVLFIDTDYVMSTNLFFDLIQEQNDDEYEVFKLFKKVDVCFVNNFDELIFKLNSLILSQTKAQTDYDLIIIDSIFGLLISQCLIRRDCEKSIEIMHSKIDLFIELISKLLLTSTILTTNSLKHNNIPGNWTNRCDLILELTKEEQQFSTECTFHLKILKSFECLNSLSCYEKSKDFLIDLKDDYIRNSQKSSTATINSGTSRSGTRSSQTTTYSSSNSYDFQNPVDDSQHSDSQETNDSQIIVSFSPVNSQESADLSIDLNHPDSELSLCINPNSLNSDNSQQNSLNNYSNNSLSSKEKQIDAEFNNDLIFTYKLTDKGSITCQ